MERRVGMGMGRMRGRSEVKWFDDCMICFRSLYNTALVLVWSVGCTCMYSGLRYVTSFIVILIE